MKNYYEIEELFYHTVHNIHYAPCGFSLKLYAEDDTLETLSKIISRSNSSSFLTLMVTWWPDKKFSASILDYYQPPTTISKPHRYHEDAWHKSPSWSQELSLPEMGNIKSF